MSKKIFILEVFSSEDRRTLWSNAETKFTTNFVFVKKIGSDEIKSFIDSISTVTDLPYIIFAHISDIEKIEKRGKLCNATKNIPLVFYSGGANIVYKLDGLLLDNLHISVLQENLDGFLSAVKKETNISPESLGRLVSIDPKLEELIKPFATANPFVTCDELKDAKNKLNNYLNK